MRLSVKQGKGQGFEIRTMLVIHMELNNKLVLLLADFRGIFFSVKAECFWHLCDNQYVCMTLTAHRVSSLS